MLDSFKNTLVLAPHTDDGELGAGGTISKLIEQGSQVTYVAFTSAIESLPAGFHKDTLKHEVAEAVQVLGINKENLIIYDYKVRKLNFFRQEILENLITLRNKNNFDLVLLPSLNDIHQDHATIAQEGLRAFKNTTMLGYELIWNNLAFSTSCFVSLERKHVQAKVNALKNYKSQQKRAYMSEDFIYSLAKSRGVQTSCEYAESFEAIRLIF